MWSVSRMETFRINTLAPEMNFVSWISTGDRSQPKFYYIDKGTVRNAYILFGCCYKLSTTKRLDMELLSTPAVTLAAWRSLPIATDGTRVRSAALWRNSVWNKSLYYVKKHLSPNWKNQESIHTYDQPHGFHQPTKCISWNVSGGKIRSAKSNVEQIRRHSI